METFVYLFLIACGVSVAILFFALKAESKALAEEKKRSEAQADADLDIQLKLNAELTIVSQNLKIAEAKLFTEKEIARTWGEILIDETNGKIKTPLEAVGLIKELNARINKSETTLSRMNRYYKEQALLVAECDFERGARVQGEKIKGGSVVGEFIGINKYGMRIRTDSGKIPYIKPSSAKRIGL